MKSQSFWYITCNIWLFFYHQWLMVIVDITMGQGNLWQTYLDSPFSAHLLHGGWHQQTLNNLDIFMIPSSYTSNRLPMNAYIIKLFRNILQKCCLNVLRTVESFSSETNQNPNYKFWVPARQHIIKEMFAIVK